MNNSGTINIGYNKVSGMGALAGSLYLFGIGIYRIVYPRVYAPPTNAMFGHTALALVILVGGITAFFSIRKLISTSPLLILSDEGITSKSPGNDLGFVPWADVVEIRMSKIMFQNFLIVVLKRPEDFINKQTSNRKKFLLTSSFKRNGSPFIISLGALMGSAEELQKLVTNKFEAYKSRSPEGVAG